MSTINSVLPQVDGESVDVGQQISANLIIGDNFFTSTLSNVLGVVVLDSLGNELELSTKINGTNIEICSLVEINNVLINILGGS